MLSLEILSLIHCFLHVVAVKVEKESVSERTEDKQRDELLYKRENGKKNPLNRFQSTLLGNRSLGREILLLVQKSII